MLDDHRRKAVEDILAIAPAYPSAALLGYPVILTKPAVPFARVLGPQARPSVVVNCRIRCRNSDAISRNSATGLGYYVDRNPVVSPCGSVPARSDNS
jgi:hypothetical protein